MSLGGPELDATAWKLIVLQPEIGLAEANELKITLLASLEEPAVELDASRVRQIGTAGVQLLVATALELQKRSRPLHISIASESFCEALSLCGVERLLPKPALVTFD
jgi:anti-anti-sigma regulatory factor